MNRNCRRRKSRHRGCAVSRPGGYLANRCHHFFCNDTATTEIYTLPLHDALPIWRRLGVHALARGVEPTRPEAGWHRRRRASRSEEHTSELQSPYDLVCRLLLEKKKTKNKIVIHLSKKKKNTKI